MGEKKTFGKQLIEATQEALDRPAGKITLKSSSVNLPALPQKLSKKEIKSIREPLCYSQSVFAKYLGVSDKALKAWEQRITKPTGPALRLLAVAEQSRELFETIIQSSSYDKGGKRKSGSTVRRR